MIGKRGAIRCEPVIGEGERTGQIKRPPMRLGIGASLERVAATRPERLREIPVGAAAGEAEAIHRVRRDVALHAGGEAVVARGDIIRSGRGIAIDMARAAEGRAPRRPALIEALWLRFRLRPFQGLGISQRHIGRQACVLLRRKTCRAAADMAAAARGRIEHQLHEIRHQLVGAFARTGRRLAG